MILSQKYEIWTKIDKENAKLKRRLFEAVCNSEHE